MICTVDIGIVLQDQGMLAVESYLWVGPMMAGPSSTVSLARTSPTFIKKGQHRSDHLVDPTRAYMMYHLPPTHTSTLLH